MAELSRAEYRQLGMMWNALKEFLHDHNMTATLSGMETLIYISAVEAKGSTDPMADALNMMVKDTKGEGATIALENLEKMKDAVKRKMT